MRLRDALPKGQTLPDESWERRHRWMLALLALNAVGLLAFSLLRAFPLWHALLDAAPVAALGLLAWRMHGRKLRSALAATGLLSASAVLVHVSDGYIEAHFHFFVMLFVLALYEDWLPFGLAAAYVALHHGIGGAIAPHTVYNHPDAIAHPWKWAAIHAAAVASAGIVAMVSWRLNELVRESNVRALAAAWTSEERFRSAFENAMIGMSVTGPEGQLLRVNRALCEMLGYSEAELSGRRWAEITHPDDLDKSAEGRRRTLAGDQDGFSCEKRYIHADGHVVWVSLMVRLVREPDGRPLHFVGQVQDVTEQKEATAALAHQALHDPLTGLPNRTLLLDRLEQALARARRSGGRVAVVFIDVDRFKVVNDNFGHASGDGLLVQIASRLSEAVRASDSVARFGGDEFVLLLDGVENEHVTLQLTDRIRRDLVRPFSLDGDEDFFATASLGVALSDALGASAETLVRDADAAMYRAKAAGGGRYELFDANMRKEAVAALRTERDLRHGLARGELRVHYQPIWALGSGRIEAVEALVRWERPGHGLLLPAAFIAIAEESDLILSLGEWVLQQACDQAAAWRAEFGDDAPLPVHVNVSARQLAQPELPALVARALASAGIAATDLALEITESGLLESTERPAAVMQALKALGVRIVLDDFGTGYSSLSYLHRFPIDELKIDREFVARLGIVGEDAAIVQAVVAMAHALGLCVVGEGVETDEQVVALHGLGCERAQGFWLARPSDAEHIGMLVRQSPRHRARAMTMQRVR
ncbi:MAG TPA: EAL domain-containing protein [Solirubrobacteraceae bacterium]|nr:EAL domain-containing protein [Solirubrobacteraceae bacterium]